MITWKDLGPDKPIISSRAVGWTLRALVKVYQVTGDERLLDKAAGIVDAVKTYRGQDPSPLTGITYHYMARNIYGGDKHNMTLDFELPWHLAVGMYGLAIYARETADPTIPPIIDEMAHYIVNYCIREGVVVDALACDNHDDYNPKVKNDGVNTWLPSALAIAWRVHPDPAYYTWAKTIIDQNDHDFLDAENFYHWYHEIGELIDEQEAP